MAGGEEDVKVLTSAEIKKFIKDFTSTDPEKRTSAGKELVKCSKATQNIDRLLQVKFDSDCGKIVDDVLDSRRDAAITCMSRMACKKVTENVEFNEGSLTTCRQKFDQNKAERKGKVLDAVRLFALDAKSKVTSSLHDTEVFRYQLVGEIGWVEVALACAGDLDGPAILLLDALKDFVSLPGLVTEHPKSLSMLEHAIISGKEPEKLAGLRVVSQVLSSLKQGLEEAPLPPQATAWLEGLRKAKIVRAVRDCIDGSASEAVVVTAVQTLTDLSRHEMFLTDLGQKKVLRALVDHVLSKNLLSCSIFELLQRVLTFQVAADHFTKLRGHVLCMKLLGTDGVEEAVSRRLLTVLSVWLSNAENPESANAFTGLMGACFDFLQNCGQESVRPVLALRITWLGMSTNSFDALKGRSLPMARLVNALPEQDGYVVNGARILVSWALQLDSQTRHKLVEHLGNGATDAVKSLLVHLVQALTRTWSVLGALHCLISTLVHDEGSATIFAEAGVIDGLLSLISDASLDASVTGMAMDCTGMLRVHSNMIHELLEEKNNKAILDAAVHRQLEAAIALLQVRS